MYVFSISQMQWIWNWNSMWNLAWCWLRLQANHFCFNSNCFKIMQTTIHLLFANIIWVLVVMSSPISSFRFLLLFLEWNSSAVWPCLFCKCVGISILHCVSTLFTFWNFRCPQIQWLNHQIEHGMCRCWCRFGTFNMQTKLNRFHSIYCLWHLITLVQLWPSGAVQHFPYSERTIHTNGHTKRLFMVLSG